MDIAGAGLASTMSMKYRLLLYEMSMESPLVRHVYERSVVSSTAFGLEMSMKSLVCGRSFTYDPFGSFAL